MKVTCIYKDYPVDKENKISMNEVIEIVKFSEYNYEGFILSLKTTLPGYIIVECKELDIYYKTFGRIDYVTNEFKKTVDIKLEENKKNRRNSEAICVPWKFLINNKTFVVDYIPETNQYYCNVTPFLTLTGKSVQEVVTQLGELAEAFSKHE